LCLLAGTLPVFAQSLGWEGETGVFVTPLAYTANSETRGIRLLCALVRQRPAQALNGLPDAARCGLPVRERLDRAHARQAVVNLDQPGGGPAGGELGQSGFVGLPHLAPSFLTKKRWCGASWLALTLTDRCSMEWSVSITSRGLLLFAGIHAAHF
jgi:hypothetical protein